MTNYADKIRQTYNVFNGKNLDVLDGFYDSEVEFIDPVTRVKGLSQLKKYYAHAYSRVKNIRFDFSSITSSDRTVTAPWEMSLAVSGLNFGKPFQVSGVSLLRFNEKGLVLYQRDYLDLGSMIYERIPLQGPLIKLIKKQLAPEL